MKSLLFMAGLIALPAQAQIYRWIDPDTGSVKFSNTPPPWFRDAEGQPRGPAVEVIAPRRQPAKPAPDKPAVVKPTPDKSAPGKPVAQTGNEPPPR